MGIVICDGSDDVIVVGSTNLIKEWNRDGKSQYRDNRALDE